MLAHNFLSWFLLVIFPHSYCVIIFVIDLSLRFISRFGRFHEDFNIPFTLSNPFTSLSLSPLSLSPLYPFHLSIPFTSLSLSPLYPFHLSIPFTSLSLSSLYPFHLSNPFTSLSLSPLSLSLSSSVFVLVNKLILLITDFIPFLLCREKSLMLDIGCTVHRAQKIFFRYHVFSNFQ